MGLFEKIYERFNSEKCSEFVLGKKFPWKGYDIPGDHINVALFETSFDVVISLCNLSEQEKNAIGKKEFEVFITATEKVPFIIMKFGEVFKADMTINLMKMDSDFHDIWFKSSLDKVRIFLLEGNDATLQSIRTFNFLYTDFIKDICRNQQNFSKEEIDAHISNVYQQIPIDYLIQHAQAHFVVPAAITL